MRWLKQTLSNPNLGLHLKKDPTLSSTTTLFQINSPLNLPKNPLPLQLLSRNLSRSPRKEKSARMMRNSNSGSPSGTLTLSTLDSKTKTIKSTMIMASNKTMDINLISMQVYKENAVLMEIHTKLDSKPKKTTGLQTLELPLNQSNLELLSTIKPRSPKTR